MIPIFCGYDPREAICYHAFCNSVITRTKEPVSFTPIQGGLRDGSNAFTYPRFHVPFLMDYEGWALYADGDMVCLADIAELWTKRDAHYAVQVVKHDYKTKAVKKYLDCPNEDYPRKNWSSLILWNCSHDAHKILTPERVRQSTGQFLHRFQWVADSQIGELPIAWNWLDLEYDYNPAAKLVHFTLGAPCFEKYRNSPHSTFWHDEKEKLLCPE